MRLVLVHLYIVVLIQPAVAQSPPALHWYKGNLHSHTINSDGDSPPYEVMAWYKRNGYQFLAITDHNTYTDPAAFDTNPNDEFLLIGGEEVTNERVVHLNAIGITRAIPAQRGSSVTEILQNSIDSIRAQDAVPLINHPNFLWALTANDMLPLKGAVLLEIASGHPLVNHASDGRSPSTEEMWDQLLSAGTRVFGVSVDDAHNFRQEFTIERANPGRGWVVARAPTLTRESILAALNNGDFYASSGVELKNIISTSDSVSVEIKASAVGQIRYRVIFIGSGGRILAVSNENPAHYKVLGNEGYVRARVEDSRGHRAWTQPVFVTVQR